MSTTSTPAPIDGDASAGVNPTHRVQWHADCGDWYSLVGPFMLHAMYCRNSSTWTALATHGGQVIKVAGPFNDDASAKDAAVEKLREHITEHRKVLDEAEVVLGNAKVGGGEGAER